MGIDVYNIENGRKTHRCVFTPEGVSQNRADNITTLEFRCSECGHRGTWTFPAHLIDDDLLTKLLR